jgi:hypothetical protein
MQLTYHEWNPTVIMKAIALQIGPLTEQSRPFLRFSTAVSPRHTRQLPWHDLPVHKLCGWLVGCF